MQRLNTFLLLVAIALLAALWMRPQPGRYVLLDSGSDGADALDTASGRIVLLQVSPEAKQRWEQVQRAEAAEQQQERETWLAETCPQILAGINPTPGSLHPFARRVALCKEWKTRQATQQSAPAK